MNENEPNEYYWYFVNKNGEKELYKPSPKRKSKRAKSYSLRVIEYLRDEWGVESGFLSDDALANLLEQIDTVEYEGTNVPNSALLVMKTMWNNGLERPEFDTN
jgi:hypothetical protein